MEIEYELLKSSIKLNTNGVWKLSLHYMSIVVEPEVILNDVEIIVHPKQSQINAAERNHNLIPNL